MVPVSLDLVNRALFPLPQSSYGVNDFEEELIWLPKSLNPEGASPEDCIPCLLLSSPSARFFILYLHGNAEDLGRCYKFCSLLRHFFHVHVLAVEYPGYGICPGRADEESVTENANVALRFLIEVLQWPLDGILVFGRSVGCGPALALAVQKAIYGVVLVCPFLSVRELCRDFLGSVADLIGERFPNLERVRQIRSPLLLVHGKKDTLVPWSHGKALFEACRTRKHLVAPEHMDHNAHLYGDASFLVLPMLHFFGLPDYDFGEMIVPEWVFDKRLSPFYQKSDEPAAPHCDFHHFRILRSGSDLAEAQQSRDADQRPGRHLRPTAHQPVLGIGRSTKEFVLGGGNPMPCRTSVKDVHASAELVSLPESEGSTASSEGTEDSAVPSEPARAKAGARRCIQPKAGTACVTVRKTFVEANATRPPSRGFSTFAADSVPLVPVNCSIADSTPSCCRRPPVSPNVEECLAASQRVELIGDTPCKVLCTEELPDPPDDPSPPQVPLSREVAPGLAKTLRGCAPLPPQPSDEGYWTVSF